jgi:uncharacterized protein with GYD domain
MAIYVLLSSLTEEGAQTLRDRPQRLKEVNREVEGMGCKILSQFAVLGPYDFVTVVDAPNNETIAKISTVLGARGSVHVMSLAAIPIDNFLASLT